MQSLTIQIHDEIYQRLVECAVDRQKTPEVFAAECLAVSLSLQTSASVENRIFSGEAVAEIVTKFVVSWGGKFLSLGKPSFDPKGSIWRVQLFVPYVSKSLQARNPVSSREVGTVQIDAQTGAVLTPYEEVKAIFSEIQSKLGIEPFPKNQQDRLSDLLAQNRAGNLNPQQQQELDDLMEAADAQEIDNLKRLPDQIPTQRAG